MKMLKNNKILICLLIFIIAVCIFVIVFTNADSTTKVYNYKTWEILFDKPLSEKEMDELKVSVSNSKGDQEKVTFNWISNNDVLINPPDKGYSIGGEYTLKIYTNINFKLDRKIKDIKSVNFKILDTGNVNDKVIFADKNLENAVRKAINKPKGDLKKSDVESLNTLVITSANIRNLSGIENLCNVRMLMLDVNSIEDINPLKKLIELQYLGLSHNNIKNLAPIKKLTNLVRLSLDGNPIKSYKTINNITKGLEWKDYNNK